MLASNCDEDVAPSAEAKSVQWVTRAPNLQCSPFVVGQFGEFDLTGLPHGSPGGILSFKPVLDISVCARYCSHWFQVTLRGAQGLNHAKTQEFNGCTRSLHDFRW